MGRAQPARHPAPLGGPQHRQRAGCPARPALPGGGRASAQRPRAGSARGGAGRHRPGRGGRLLGHIDLAFGSRPFGELVADARSYLDWYRVGGFYLDRCPAERDGLPAVRRLTSTLAALLSDSDSADEEGGRLVLGHGTHPHPGYAEAADQLVTFRGAWTDYRWSQVAEWTASYPPGRFAHFVHGVPRTHLEEAMRIARWQGAGTIFFTDRDGTKGQTDPFAAPPSYWDEFVSRIGPGISE